MFAVLYRGYVPLHLQEDYKAAWKIIASYFIQEKNALGSTLHQAEDGMWIGYSKWPDKKTRDAAWSAHAIYSHPQPIISAIESLKKCLDKERLLPEICMDIVESLD